ncbi:MAG: hypothetical protein N3G22_04825 [Candidatus Micrarchaeota archaeon]|nr:hypothetical protein [Candidatus Micrarchaeota archaeon]
MKINIGEITYEEVQEVLERLRKLRMEAKIIRLGSSVVIQTDYGAVQIPKNEAAELFGIPALF